MNRGIVMELEGGMAIVMTSEGQFLRVRAAGRDYQVGLETEWAADDVVASREKPNLVRMRRMARFGAYAAAVMIVVVAAVLWSFRDPVVVAYVSMDVNPSIEMGLDSRERVRELRAVNPDAETLIEGIAYRGKQVEQVTGTLAGKMADFAWLQDDTGEIVIASVRLATVDEQWEARVTDKIKNALEQAAKAANEVKDAGSDDPAAAAKTVPVLTIETVFLPVEVREEAEEQGISSGKMAFYLAAEQSGHKVDLRALQSASVTEVASSMGGLKQVMSGDEAAKKNQEEWKKLLSDAKQHDKQLQADSRKTNGGKKDTTDSQDEGKENGKNNGKGKDNSTVKNNNTVEGNSGGKGNGKSEVEDRDWRKTNGKDKEKDDDKQKDNGKSIDQSNRNGNNKGNGKGSDQGNGSSNNKGNGKDKGNVKGNGQSNGNGKGNVNGNVNGNGNGNGKGNVDKGNSNNKNQGNGKRGDDRVKRGDDRKDNGRGEDYGNGPNRVRGSDRL